MRLTRKNGDRERETETERERKRELRGRESGNGIEEKGRYGQDAIRFEDRILQAPIL